MVEFKKATLNDIIADAQENDRVAELKALAKKTNDEGAKISYMELKRAYYLKFYKKMVPVAKPKQPTMWERIADL